MLARRGRPAALPGPAAQRVGLRHRAGAARRRPRAAGLPGRQRDHVLGRTEARRRGRGTPGDLAQPRRLARRRARRLDPSGHARDQLHPRGRGQPVPSRTRSSSRSRQSPRTNANFVSTTQVEEGRPAGRPARRPRPRSSWPPTPTPSSPPCGPPWPSWRCSRCSPWPGYVACQHRHRHRPMLPRPRRQSRHLADTSCRIQPAQRAPCIRTTRDDPVGSRDRSSDSPPAVENRREHSGEHSRTSPTGGNPRVRVLPKTESCVRRRLDAGRSTSERGLDGDSRTLLQMPSQRRWLGCAQQA